MTDNWMGRAFKRRGTAFAVCLAAYLFMLLGSMASYLLWIDPGLWRGEIAVFVQRPFLFAMPLAAMLLAVLAGRNRAPFWELWKKYRRQ